MRKSKRHFHLNWLIDCIFPSIGIDLQCTARSENSVITLAIYRRIYLSFVHLKWNEWMKECALRIRIRFFTRALNLVTITIMMTIKPNQHWTIVKMLLHWVNEPTKKQIYIPTKKAFRVKWKGKENIQGMMRKIRVIRIILYKCVESSSLLLFFRFKIVYLCYYKQITHKHIYNIYFIL